MTHYYYYVIAGPVCDNTSEILKVSLGNSAQGRRDYLFLTAYSVQHGHYFEVVSDESVEFALNLLESLQLSSLDIHHMTGRELVRYLKYGYRPTLSSAPVKAADQQRRHLDDNYRIIMNLRRAGVSPAKRVTL